MDYQYKIAAQSIPGTSKTITFLKYSEADTKLTLPALRTTSLSLAEKLSISAVHIEVKMLFRLPKEKTPSVSQEGVQLGEAIAPAMWSPIIT